MPDIAEDYVTIDGIRTHYVVSGRGAPLLLVHGWGGSWSTYRRNIAELSEGHRVFAVDLPGNGDSAFPEGADFTAEAGGVFVSHFLESIVGEPAAVAGVSAGGLLSLLAANQRPDLFTHLILISSAGLGRGVSWSLRLVTLPGLDPFVGQATPGAVRLALSHQIYDQSLITDELVEELCRERRAGGNRLALLLGLRRNVSLLGVKRWRRHFRAVRGLAMPVLILWGRQDRLIPVRHAYRGLRAIAGARLQVFDRCGHLPPYERPQEFNRAVREFLA